MNKFKSAIFLVFCSAYLLVAIGTPNPLFLEQAPAHDSDSILRSNRATHTSVFTEPSTGSSIEILTSNGLDQIRNTADDFLLNQTEIHQGKMITTYFSKLGRKTLVLDKSRDSSTWFHYIDKKNRYLKRVTNGASSKETLEVLSYGPDKKPFTEDDFLISSLG